MLVHHLLPQHHRQELVECDVLDQSGGDVTSFLTGKLIFNQNYNLSLNTCIFSMQSHLFSDEEQLQE